MIMKSVAEIAEELEVSRQTIYYWINKLDENIKKHIYKDGRTKVIDDPGVDMIREQVKGKTKIERPFNQGYKYPIESPTDREIKERLTDLKKQNELLERQLQQKDKQIDRLNNNLDKAQENVKALTGRVEKDQQGLFNKIKEFFAGGKD